MTTGRAKCGTKGLMGHGVMRRGFSLVEVLTVMAIITLLMAAASGLLDSAVSKSGEPAARIARGVEFARAQAVARNRSVAIRFERPEDRVGRHTSGNEMVMRFLWKRTGQTTDQATELRHAERFNNIMISPEVVRTWLPEESLASHRLAADESLVVTADGQVFVGTGKQGFPEVSDELYPLIHVGVQPTREGRVVPSERRDVAIVQIQSATGTARVTQP